MPSVAPHCGQSMPSPVPQVLLPPGEAPLLVLPPLPGGEGFGRCTVRLAG